MANFEDAWRITSSFEGPWEAETASTRSDSGNFLDKDKKKENFYGTVYGLTADFLKNFDGWKISNDAKEPKALSKLRYLSKEDCGKIWKRIVWDKMMQGDRITDQSVATLLFDTLVHRQNFITEYFYKVWNEGPILTFFKSEFGIKVNPTGLSELKPNNSFFGGNSDKNTDKAPILTDFAITKINQAIQSDAKGFFDRLNAARKAAEAKWGAKKRMNAFEYGNIKSLGDLERAASGSSTKTQSKKPSSKGSSDIFAETRKKMGLPSVKFKKRKLTAELNDAELNDKASDAKAGDGNNTLLVVGLLGLGLWAWSNSDNTKKRVSGIGKTKKPKKNKKRRSFFGFG